MPPTKSRRRKVQDEDIIEEADPTPPSPAEDVEDDAQEHPHRSVSRKSSKAHKGNRIHKRRKGAAEENEETKSGDENGNETVFKIEDFRDQPLSRLDGAKVASLASDWDVLLKNFRGSALTLATEVGAAMAESSLERDNEKIQEELESVDEIMRQLLNLQAELQANRDVLDDMRDRIALEERIDNVIERYETSVAEKLQAWDGKTSRQKYAKDEEYLKFKSRIFEIQNPDHAMPPVTDFIPKEDGDESEDEDIIVGGVSQVYTCPISLTVLDKPMTSQVCNHSFSRAAIYDYFKSNRSTKKTCPASGCTHLISLADLTHDTALEKQIKAHVRREQRREAERGSDDNGAEEIVD